MKGVPHYLANGKLYPAFLPTHKSGGRLMTGKNHTSKSVFLYDAGELKKKK
jgi:hypothetical protein